MGLILIALSVLAAIGIFYVLESRQKKLEAQSNKPQGGGIWWATPEAIADFKERNPNTIEDIPDGVLAFVVDVLANVEQQHGTNRWTATSAGRELLLIDVVRAAAEMDYHITYRPKLCANCNELWPCDDMRDVYVHAPEVRSMVRPPGPFGEHFPVSPFEGRNVIEGVEWHDAPSH